MQDVKEIGDENAEKLAAAQEVVAQSFAHGDVEVSAYPCRFRPHEHAYTPAACYMEVLALLLRFIA